MASNSLSKRRDILRRPIVCKKGPPPIPTPEAPCLCTLTLVDPEEIFVEEDYQFNVEACDPAFPPDLLFEPIMSATAGEWSSPEPVNNCGGGDDTNWAAPEDPGFVTLGFTVTFPNDFTCGAEIIVQVLPEDDD
jgi:hypothetical protein